MFQSRLVHTYLTYLGNYCGTLTGVCEPQYSVLTCLTYPPTYLTDLDRTRPAARHTRPCLRYIKFALVGCRASGNAQGESITRCLVPCGAAFLRRIAIFISTTPNKQHNNNDEPESATAQLLAPRCFPGPHNICCGKTPHPVRTWLVQRLTSQDGTPSSRLPGPLGPHYSVGEENSASSTIHMWNRIVRVYSITTVPEASVCLSACLPVCLSVCLPVCVIMRRKTINAVESSVFPSPDSKVVQVEGS